MQGQTTNNNVQQETEVIIRAIKQFADGASINDIKKTSGLDIQKRTLQRRLTDLLEQGIITTSGRARAVRYHLAKTATGTEVVSNDLLRLSDTGREIQQMVARPEQQLQPVGYNRDFLESYRPNEDSYLSPAEKKMLEETGKTHSMGQPAGTYAKEILQRLLIDLSWNSSRLEGNTYSLLDTQRLINYGEVAGGRPAVEAQMILNHKEAIEFLVQSTDDIDLNRYTLLNLHALLSNNLLPDPAASGRLRTFGVGIQRSVFIPLGIPQQIEEMFELMLAKARHIENPFEQALFIMVQLPYLQPFDDVNKRVSRLAANISLNRYNLSPLAFVDVPDDIYIQGTLGVYELNRTELLKDVFIWAYQRSAARYGALRQSLGEPDPFRMKYREQIRSLIMEIVAGALPPGEASVIINAGALQLPENERSRFTEIIDTELLSLHEGNFARYRIRPSEFRAWEKIWKRK